MDAETPPAGRNETANKLRTVQYEQVLAILSAVPILPGELDADPIAALEEFLSAEARR